MIPIFYHIPKTAGTSLSSFIRREYIDLRGCCVERTKELVCGCDIFKSGNKIMSATGHLGYKASFYTKDECVVFSLLRNPIDRFFSNHNMIINALGKNTTAVLTPMDFFFESKEFWDDTYLESDIGQKWKNGFLLNRCVSHHKNFYCKSLHPFTFFMAYGNIDISYDEAFDVAKKVIVNEEISFDHFILGKSRKFKFFVGITEDFKNSLEFFKRVFDWKYKTKIFHLNTGQRNFEISDLSMKNFRKYNEMDFELYNLALKKFSQYKSIFYFPTPTEVNDNLEFPSREIKTNSNNCNLTVIIPAYKKPVSLKRCLDSALKFLPKAKVIVVFDYDTEIIIDFKTRYPSCKFLTNGNNKGALSSILRGVRESNTEFVGFIGDDVEFLTPNSDELIVSSMIHCKERTISGLNDISTNNEGLSHPFMRKDDWFKIEHLVDVYNHLYFSAEIYFIARNKGLWNHIGSVDIIHHNNAFSENCKHIKTFSNEKISYHEGAILGKHDRQTFLKRYGWWMENNRPDHIFKHIGIEKDININWQNLKPRDIHKDVANLIKNPGFEEFDNYSNEPTYWESGTLSHDISLGKRYKFEKHSNANNDIKFALECQGGNNNSHCVSIENNNRESKEMGVWKQSIQIKPSTVYVVSGYLGFENISWHIDGFCNIQIFFKDSNNKISDIIGVKKHHGSRKLEYNFPSEGLIKSPHNSRSAEIWLILRGGGKVEFDDIFFGEAPTGNVFGNLTCGGKKEEGAIAKIYGDPFGMICESTANKSGNYSIENIPISSPRYIVLFKNRGYKTKAVGKISANSDKSTDVNLISGNDPKDNIRIKFASITDYFGIPFIPVPLGSEIPSSKDDYPIDIAEYLGSDGYISPENKCVLEIARNIKNKIPKEKKWDTRVVASSVLYWMFHHVQQEDLYFYNEDRNNIERKMGDFIRDTTNGMWQSSTPNGWCHGRSFLDWCYKPHEVVKSRSGICIEQSWLACSILRAFNIPAKSILGYLQFWAQNKKGDGKWIFMSPSLGGRRYQEGSQSINAFEYLMDPGFYMPKEIIDMASPEEPMIHAYWETENPCLWREVHPFQVIYDKGKDGIKRAENNFNKFISSGEINRNISHDHRNVSYFDINNDGKSVIGHIIHVCDITINLYNIGDQKDLIIRFPSVSNCGKEDSWVNYPECIKKKSIEMVGKKKLFKIDLDLSPLLV